MTAQLIQFPRNPMRVVVNNPPSPFADIPQRRPWSPHRVTLTYAAIKAMCESNFFTATRSSDPRAIAAARNTLSDIARYSNYVQARELAARLLRLSDPNGDDAA